MAIENLIFNFAQKRLRRKSHHSCCSAHSQSLHSAERERERESARARERHGDSKCTHVLTHTVS